MAPGGAWRQAPVSDRRARPRVTGLTARVFFQHQGQTFQAELGNLSQDGAMFKCDQPLVVGTSLPFAFELYGLPRPIRLLARVVWVQPGETSPRGTVLNRVGIHFERIVPDDLRGLVWLLGRYGG